MIPLVSGGQAERPGLDQLNSFCGDASLIDQHPYLKVTSHEEQALSDANENRPSTTSGTCYSRP